MERLQKYLARSGIASRRKSEEMVKAGLVSVNGMVITEMGYKVEALRDRVTVNGKDVRPEEEMVYLLFHKPLRVVTTLSDPQGRQVISSFVKDLKQRVYPVGRLDYLTSGLLLLTNDGEMAYRLTHPKFKVDKVYIVGVEGMVTNRELQTLKQGVMLDGSFTMPAKVRSLQAEKGHMLLEIIISEGRNRQVRRMLEAVGHKVSSLKRVRFGNLSLENLKSGEYRHLTNHEVEGLRKACHLPCLTKTQFGYARDNSFDKKGHVCGKTQGKTSKE